MVRRVVLGTFALLFGGMFGLVWSSQVLGFLGMYTLVSAVALSLILSILAIWGYFRVGQAWFSEVASEQEIPTSTSFDITLLIVSLVLLGTVFLFRMVTWPYSELASTVPEDFFGYHAIRVIDLAQSGTIWNLSIPYGQYSNGYESILSFFYLLTGSVQWAGLVQAWTLLLLVITLALLLFRYARLPLAIGLALSVALLFLPFFYGQMLLIGKNDLLLTVTVLIAILHAPIGTKQNHLHPLGMAYATMLAISIKATGVTILAPLWLLVLWQWGRAYRVGSAAQFLHPGMFVLTLLLMFPGGLWVIRNYLMMGMVVSPEIASFSVTSIAANLSNPLLYTSGSESTWLLLGFGAMLAIFLLLLITRRMGWEIAVYWLAMVAAFMITPLGAFHTPISTTLHVEWRYALHLPFLGVVIVLVFLAPLILHFYREIQQKQIVRYIVSGLLIVGAVGILWALNPAELFSLEADRARILRDPYGDQGGEYETILDYAQQEITEGTVFLGIVPRYYLLIAHPDLVIVEKNSYPLGLPPLEETPIPDYAILYRQAPYLGVALPEGYTWELMYEDFTGKVFRRIP